MTPEYLKRARRFSVMHADPAYRHILLPWEEYENTPLSSVEAEKRNPRLFVAHAIDRMLLGGTYERVSRTARAHIVPLPRVSRAWVQEVFELFEIDREVQPRDKSIRFRSYETHYSPNALTDRCVTSCAVCLSETPCFSLVCDDVQRTAGILERVRSRGLWSSALDPMVWEDPDLALPCLFSLLLWGPENALRLLYLGSELKERPLGYARWGTHRLGSDIGLAVDGSHFGPWIVLRAPSVFVLTP